MQTIYIFLDEGGNLDFSKSGTRFFSLSCVSMLRPFTLHTRLDTYKYDLIEYGIDTEAFHCAEDNTRVRAKVFEILGQSIKKLRIDSLVVEKCKTGPALQKPQEFYPRMLGYLLRYVIKKAYSHNRIAELVVITDTIPVSRRRKAIEKSVKTTLAEMLTKDASYRVFHHSSKAHYGLQIADYCNWAIFRKWERQDNEHYKTIKPALKSEYDIFKTGVKKYY